MNKWIYKDCSECHIGRAINHRKPCPAEEDTVCRCIDGKHYIAFNDEDLIAITLGSK